MPISSEFTATWFAKLDYAQPSSSAFCGFQIGSQTSPAANDIQFLSVAPHYQGGTSGIGLRGSDPFNASYGNEWNTQSDGWVSNGVWYFCYVKHDGSSYEASFNGVSLTNTSHGPGTRSGDFLVHGCNPTTTTAVNAPNNKSAKFKVYASLLDASELAALAADPPS